MRIRTRGFLAALASALMSIGAFAGSDERTISFYHIHTQESLTVTYKRDGHFIPEAMKQIDWLMRDWRKNIAIPIDPDTIDIIWEMHRELGSKEPVHVICGHRSEATNEMLRRTNGGQAKHSEHITGKAVDITFPDIPVKQLRYSAMIRERGGVGYYPTSGIPFVHVDTGRVRSWPNMPRDELALLFPSGHSQHRTDDGGYITPSDVKRAREHSPGLAQQVAAFFEARDRQQAILLAESTSQQKKPPVVLASALVPPAPRPAERKKPPLAPEQKMALAAPLPIAPPPAAVPQRQPAPKLVAAPKLVERPSKFTKGPSKEDRGKLEALVTLAAKEPETAKATSVAKSAGHSPEAAKAAAPPAKSEAAVAANVPAPAPQPSAADETPMAATQSAPTLAAAIASDMLLATNETWVKAPEFDEDHPEELSYRPFPLAPLLTTTASADDPALSEMSQPDAEAIFDMVDDMGAVLPMSLRKGEQLTAMMWSQEFRGQAVDLAGLKDAGPKLVPPAPKLAERRVKTTDH